MNTIYDVFMANSELIKLIFIVIASMLAYVQFVSANAFKRSQYVSELWRKFYTTDKLVTIFQILESEDDEAFEKVSKSDVYHYLAYLEEIAIFIKNDFWEFHKVNKNEILNLFQFHFYYIYQNDKTKKIFWSKILPESDIEKEISQFYWQKQYNFSIDCKTHIEAHKK